MLFTWRIRKTNLLESMKMSEEEFAEVLLSNQQLVFNSSNFNHVFKYSILLKFNSLILSQRLNPKVNLV